MRDENLLCTCVRCTDVMDRQRIGSIEHNNFVLWQRDGSEPGAAPRSSRQHIFHGGVLLSLSGVTDERTESETTGPLPRSDCAPNLNSGHNGQFYTRTSGGTCRLVVV